MLTKLTTNQPTDSDMLAVKNTTAQPSGLKLNKLNGKVSGPKIDEVANEFEAQFVSQMLSTMFQTVDPHEALGGSDAEEVYQSMLTSEYGKIIARTGGVGVADQVKRIMITQQEVE